VETGIDGCSVVVFAVPLHAMARGYARLAAADAGSSQARDRALARIRIAMQSFPQATGGAMRFSTALMEAGERRLVAKGGAEGLECIGVPGRNLGLAIKVEDGATRAVAPAVIALLESLDLLPAPVLQSLASWRRSVFHNAAGLEVGHLEPVLRVSTPVAG
jgi:L-asparaginase II